jgi:very-short-patch-repair endonuclease
MSGRGEVLVAIINNRQDFVIAERKNWYRVPVKSAAKRLKGRWPPQWIAFYLTKKFGSEAHSVRYYAKIIEIRQVCRWQLFPREQRNEDSDKQYFQLFFNPLQKLPQPILSRRWRRIVFIPTTWQKFINAVELNDVYDDSPLENRLWAQLKRHNIPAERQFYMKVKRQHYALDFAIFCDKANIDVETDGDSYHANPEKSKQDNKRNNALEAVGWKVLRFNTLQIQEEMESYCIHKIVETINNQGGVEESKLVPRKIDLNVDGGYQLGLFDEFSGD